MNEQNAISPVIRTRSRVHWIAKAGILAAVAIALMYLETTLPLVPTFLKFDFSEIAVLLAAFSMGPLTAILIELIKNAAHLAISQTWWVGELANFFVGSIFTGTAGLIYLMHKSRWGAYSGMAVGVVVMTAGASLVNYFIMIPLYASVAGFPLEAIIGAARSVGNTRVTDLKTLIVWVFVPFNLFKGIVVSLIVGLIYKRISPLLHRWDHGRNK
jgi:riboflavin transporter